MRDEEALITAYLGLNERACCYRMETWAVSVKPFVHHTYISKYCTQYLARYYIWAKDLAQFTANAEGVRE